ncbi:hypothetical protein Mgrana_00110 [Meiothermus granaticius NBRC 107808]|uniref:Uncharacterized protein n=1 Tax=Meiothermus granaticius NBRC 107808 TaxID=1227551 RepID=A0A399FBP5_9DEIN|nr:hypothetical protein Mgrana_00110 [Meiothermus granaticius NBRC 107808]
MRLLQDIALGAAIGFVAVLVINLIGRLAGVLP